MHVANDGTIYVLSRKTHIVPRIDKTKPIFEDFVKQLSADGRVMREVSLLECLENSPYAPLLQYRASWGDIFHANTLEYLDGRYEDVLPAFRQGNFMTSLRELNVIGVVDLDAKSFVWAMDGLWSRQHDPTLVSDGHVLLFDNKGNDGLSKALEFNPLTQEIVWTYGVAPNEPLNSPTCSTCQRLPNGNTLITESDNGRAIEVTPDNTVVWEYINPHRTGDKNEFIAILTEVRRLPPDFPVHWARKPENGS
jgi:hypothetical protein